jgi:hypothetical protein
VKGIAYFAYSIIRPPNMFQISPSDILPFLRRPLLGDLSTAATAKRGLRRLYFDRSGALTAVCCCDGWIHECMSQHGVGVRRPDALAKRIKVQYSLTVCGRKNTDTSHIQSMKSRAGSVVHGRSFLNPYVQAYCSCILKGMIRLEGVWGFWACFINMMIYSGTTLGTNYS